MKNLTTVILLILLAFTTTNAQQTSSLEEKGEVSKALYGIQIGLFGAWAHSELRLSPTTTIKLEAGMQFASLSGNSSQRSNLFAFPEFSAETRYYYNLTRRLNKGKSITKNSGNFISILAQAQPGRTLTIGNENRRYNKELGVFARWGFKRTYGEHFTLETAVGPGVIHTNIDGQNYLDATIDVEFRIGYTF